MASTTRQSSTANGGGDTGAGSVASWNQAWRDNVTRQFEHVTSQLDESAKSHQQTALIQERMLARLDEHDRRFEELKERPANARANLTGYGGCLSQAIFATLSAFGTLTGITGTIIGIIALTHHP